MGDGVYINSRPAKRQTQYRDMFTNADACGVCTDNSSGRDCDIDLKVTYAINNYMGQSAARRLHAAVHRHLSDDRRYAFTSKYPDYGDLDLVAECTDQPVWVKARPRVELMPE